MDYTGKKVELCVLIPCYNNLEGLKRSIGSICYPADQCLIVVVDDGSMEAVLPADFQQNAIPVQVIRLDQNKGITVALNQGLHWIDRSVTCDFIARLDCSDSCDPERFYKQVDFLSRNTDIGMMGSWCYFQDAEKKIHYAYKTPLHHAEIQKAMYFKNVFIHPTIIFRNEVLKKVGFYPESFPHAEDYAWCWTIVNQVKTAIIPLFLVTCELNGAGISQQYRQEQLKSRIRVVRKFGRNFVRIQVAVLKIKILMKIPYPFLLQVKKLMSF